MKRFFTFFMMLTLVIKYSIALSFNGFSTPLAVDDNLTYATEKDGKMITEVFHPMSEGSTSISVPYEIDFGTTQESWTTVDLSETSGTTWAYNAKGFYDSGRYYPCIAMNPDYSSAYNDYYVSPAIALKAGTTYEVKTIAFASGESARVALYQGTSSTDMNTMTKISDLTTPDSYEDMVVETNEIVVNQEGDYYFAFGGTTELYSPYLAYLFYFSISEKNGETPTVPNETVYDVPYTAYLSEENEDWSAIDNNSDGITWKTYSGIGTAVDATSVNDDYVSPLIQLEAGKTYIVTTQIQGVNLNADTQLSLLVAADESDFVCVKENMQIPETGEVEEKNEFKPSVSGTYTFAIREILSVEDNVSAPLYLTKFSIEEKEYVLEEGTPVFSSDFTIDNPTDGWTIVDTNKDGLTWVSDADNDAIVYASDNVENGSSEKLYSPYFPVVANQDYMVELSFSQNGAFEADNVEISWGYTSNEHLYLLEAKEIYAEGGMGNINAAYRFTPTTSGNAYIDINVVTAVSNGTLSLTNLVVTPIAKAIPNAITNLQANVNAEEKNVTLSWKNPSFDTQGLLINGNLKATIYQDGELLTTTDVLTPNEESSYTLSPDVFNGEVTFTVKTFIESLESEGVSVTVNLDDKKGNLILVKSFEDVNSTTATEWAIENIAGTSEWKYSYGNVFRFDYSLGQKNDNDWLISPAITLEANKRYVAKYELKTAQDYAANVDVTIGTEQNSTAQAQVIASYPNLKQNGFGEYETSQFTVSESGNYYIGFHVFQADNAVNMRNLAIYYVGNASSSIETAEQSQPTIAYDATTATLLLSDQDKFVTIYDLQGRNVAHLSAIAGKVNLQTLPVGMYVAKTLSGSIKIVK